MGSRLGRRVIHFANLPVKLLLPSFFTNISEIAIKTIPSASKIEVKRVLESLYGFEVEKVQTLNVEGKKKKRGGIVLAKPGYKKAYVTLRTPLSISPDLFPIKANQEEKNTMNKQSQTSILGDAEKKKPHWLDEKESRLSRSEKSTARGRRGIGRVETAKFPRSSMRSVSSKF